MQSSEPEQAFPVAWSLSFPEISITIPQGKIKSAKSKCACLCLENVLVMIGKLLLNQINANIFLYVVLESLIYSKRLIPNIPLSSVPSENLIHLSESFHSLSYATVESLIHSSKLIHSKRSSITCITGKFDLMAVTMPLTMNLKSDKFFGTTIVVLFQSSAVKL